MAGVWRYGFALRISIPEKYWGDDGWSLIMRFNGAHMQSGSFQIWNANIFNIYRKETGLEVHIQQKRNATDLQEDGSTRSSFLIVAERLSEGELPTFYFWPKRMNDNHCFDNSQLRNKKTVYDRTIEVSETVNSISDVRSVSVSRAGTMRVRL